jgi:hypothetical protein
MNIEQVINHLREREYMSGVDRDRNRVKATGEVYTPTPLVQEILDQIPQDQFTDPTKTFLDPTCGDGQFLSEIIIKKIEAGSTYEQALSTTYGADLMRDNCVECIRRLYGANGEPTIEILENEDIPPNYRRDGLTAVFRVNGTICNIVCADGIKYDYSFGESEQFEIENSPSEVQQLFQY